MLTLALIILPFIASLFCLVPGKMQLRMMALICSLITLGVSAYATVLYLADATEALTYNVVWVKNLGISFALGMDGIRKIKL